MESTQGKAPGFTPGPLTTRDNATGFAYERCRIVAPDGMDIGEAYSDPFNGLTSEAVAANGRLWAAAPDLYAACKAALCAISPHYLGQWDPHRDTSAILRKAIAKAEGREA